MQGCYDSEFKVAKVGREKECIKNFCEETFLENLGCGLLPV